MVTVSDPIQGTISRRYLPLFPEYRAPYHVRRVNGGQDERNDDQVSQETCFTLFMAEKTSTILGPNVLTILASFSSFSLLNQAVKVYDEDTALQKANLFLCSVQCVERFS